MENKPTPYKTAMNFGALLGLVLIAYSALLYALDQTTNQALSWFSYGFLAGGIVLGTKNYRDKNLGGFITYNQALWTGTLIVFFASFLSAFYTYIFTSYIDPGMITKILEETEMKMLEEQNMSEADVEVAMNYTRMFVTPGMMTITVVLATTIMGFIISLITSAILKKENPNQSFDNVIDNT